MEIFVAKPCGFCPGAKYSVDVVADRVAKSDEKAYSLGPILHNEQLVEKLRQQGIVALSLDEILSNGSSGVKTVIIRAHGVPARQIEALEKAGFKIEDGTCVHVHGIYEIVEKHEREGYTIFVYGRKDHPEVIGIVSRVKNPIVVGSVDEIPDKRYGKVCLVSQTTQRKELYDEIRRALEERCDDLTVFDTICNATRERQEAAAKLAGEVDVMLVIGGKKSNNTKKLYEICKGVDGNGNTYMIQTKDDLRKEWFSNGEKVGITAGASTPDFVVDGVVEGLRRY